MENERDVGGIQMSVSASKGGGNFNFPKLDEDLVYAAVLVKVVEDSFTYQGELKETYKWYFELTEEEHEYEAELEDNTTEVRRRRVTGSTSRIFSKKSKMYNWFSKISGETPEDGAKLGDLYDIPCNLIIKNRDGKTKKDKDDKEYTPVYANVDRIMTVKGAKKVEKKEESKKEVKKEEKTKAKKVEKKKEEKPKKKAEKIEEKSDDGEAFSDIF